MTDKKGSEVLAKLSGQGEPKTLEQFLQKMRPELLKALPKHVNVDRILRISQTALKTTPKLSSCEYMSFLAAVMTSAQLGLEVNTPLGEAYLIPRTIKGVLKAGFEIGYRGLLTLAYRTGLYRSIYAHAVYSNDKFSYHLGLHKDLIHIPSDEPIGEPIFYYAVYHTLNGGFDFSVFSRKKVEQHRDKYCPSAKFADSAWRNDFDSMALKTVLKNVLNYAPKSIELSRALSSDETVKTAIAPDMSEVPQEEFDVTPEPKMDRLAQAKAEADKIFAKDEEVADEDIPNV